MRRITCLILFVALPCGQCWALEKGPGPGPPKEDKTHPFVGRVVDMSDRFATSAGTGSLIQVFDRSVVLTAAHVINGSPDKAQPEAAFQRFERFVMVDKATGQPPAPLAGLGVRDPQYGNGDKPDVGLILLLNNPNPNGVFGTLASPNQFAGKLLDNKGVQIPGVNVSMVGYTGATTAYPLQGTAVTFDTKGEKLDASWIYDRTKSGALLQDGDSGGPSLFKFEDAERIIGVHSGTVTDPRSKVNIDIDSRVNDQMSFLQGKGDPNHLIAVFAALKDKGGDWNDATLWNRAIGGAQAPRANDIAILDPTTKTDTGIQVAITKGATRGLGGLLNDVTLTVKDGGLLRVVGDTGALNGGSIVVGGDSAGTARIGASLDNVGTVRVDKQGTLNVGQGLAAGSSETAVFNDKGAQLIIAGGQLDVAKALENRGTFTQGDGSVKVGAALPAVVTDDKGNQTDTTVGISNAKGARISIEGGKLFDSAAQLENSGDVVVKGGTVKIGTGLPSVLKDAQGNATETAVAISNVKGATIGVSGGSLEATAMLRNSGEVTVSGGTAKFGTALPGVFKDKQGNESETRSIVNAPGAKITVDSGQLESATALVNSGNVSVHGGTVKVGAALPAVTKEAGGDEAVSRSITNAKGTIVVDGGQLTVSTQVLNLGGKITVGGGQGKAAMTVGANVPKTFKSGGNDLPGNGFVNFRSSELTVKAGGTLTIHNASSSAGLANTADSSVTVEGDKKAPGTLNADTLFNDGKVEVKAGGVVNVKTSTANTATGTLDVTGGAAGKATANLGTFVNQNQVTVGDQGVINSKGYAQLLGTTTLKKGTINNVDAKGKPLDLNNNNGGELKGNGTISGKVVNDGKISFLTPSDHLQILGSLTEKAHAELDFQIGRLGPNPVLDTIDITGAGLFGDPELGHAHFDGLLELSLVGTGFLDPGDLTYVLLTSQFPITGAFENVASGSRLMTTDGRGSFRVVYSGDDLILTDFQPTAVPEPSTRILLATGCAILAAAGRRARRARR